MGSAPPFPVVLSLLILQKPEVQKSIVHDDDDYEDWRDQQENKISSSIYFTSMNVQNIHILHIFASPSLSQFLYFSTHYV
jgi:hypothetical protein